MDNKEMDNKEMSSFSEGKELKQIKKVNMNLVREGYQMVHLEMKSKSVKLFINQY